MSVVFCFIAFCLLSSAVYVINDIVDADYDRKHPINNKRPIAAGQISKRMAIAFAIALFTVGGLFIRGVNADNVALFAVLYVLINFAYTFKLKHYAVVDCFCVAAGFVLRVYAGGAACNEYISQWLLLTTLSASLCMAFGKRRGEMVQVSDINATRKVLAHYNLNFLNGIILLCASLSLVFYALWAMQSVPEMIYLVPLAMFIVCKYLLVIYGDSSYGDPVSIILNDKSLIFTIVSFGLLSTMLLYT